MKQNYLFFTYKPPIYKFVNDIENFDINYYASNDMNNNSDKLANYTSFQILCNDITNVRNHINHIINDLWHEQKSLSEQEDLIFLLKQDIRRYVQIWKYDYNESANDVRRFFKVLLALNCDLEVVSIVQDFYSEFLQNKREFKDYYFEQSLDFSDIYISAGDRALIKNKDFRLAKKFYDLAQINWNNENVKHKIYYEQEKQDSNYVAFNKKYNEIIKAIESHMKYNKISNLVEELFKIVENIFIEINDIRLFRSILIIINIVKERTINFVLCSLSENDQNSYFYLLEDIIDCLKTIKGGPSLFIADYVRNWIKGEKKNKESLLSEVIKFSKTKYIVDQLKSQLLVSRKNSKIAYYTSLDIFLFMCPNKAEKEEYIGKLAVMNISYMNDPNEGRILKKFLYGKGKKVKHEINVPYVFFKCFTKQVDYLPMWEMYADHAEGCCIVLDLNKMHKLSNKPIPLYQICYLTNQEGHYILEQDKNTHLTNFKDIKENLDALKNIYAYKSPSKEFIPTLNKLLGDIMYFFKDSSYSFEQEMRLIYTYDSATEDFKYTNNKYPLLFVYPDFPIFIKEIILAPKFINASLKIPFLQEQIEKMCMKLDFGFPTITYSKIDYR